MLKSSIRLRRKILYFPYKTFMFNRRMVNIVILVRKRMGGAADARSSGFLLILYLSVYT